MIDVLIVEQDRRYRCLVSLQRSDRPRYYTFHCPHCTMPLAEIMNAEVVGLNDAFDMSDLKNIATGIRCAGRTGVGRCSWWFYFDLNPF